MRWQRYLWTATILAIWIVSLLIVDSAANQTRIGYQKQDLRLEQEEWVEENLRLKCEMSVLHDMELAETFSETNNMTSPDGETFTVLDAGSGASD